MENHSFDIITSKPYSAYTSKEKQKLQEIAKLLIGSGHLWTKYEQDELPVLIAGLSKHSKIPKVKRLTSDLIIMLRETSKTAKGMIDSELAQMSADNDLNNDVISHLPTEKNQVYRGVQIKK